MERERKRKIDEEQKRAEVIEAKLKRKAERGLPFPPLPLPPLQCLMSHGVVN